MTAGSRTFNGNVAFNVTDNSDIKQIAVGLSANFQKDVTVNVNDSNVDLLTIANANRVAGVYTINLENATIGNLEYGNGVTSILNISGETEVKNAIANSNVITLAADSKLTANAITLSDNQVMNIASGASITLNGAFNNAGTVNIDVMDAEEYSYKVIDTNAAIVNFGSVNLENNNNYVSTVVGNDLYIVDTSTILIGSTEYDGVEHFEGVTAFGSLEDAAKYTEGERTFVYTATEDGEVSFSITGVSSGFTTVIVDGKAYDIRSAQTKVFSFSVSAGDNHTFEFTSDTDYTFESTTIAANADVDLTTRDWEAAGAVSETIYVGGGAGDKVYLFDVDSKTGSVSLNVSGMDKFVSYQIVDANDQVLASGTSNTSINKTLNSLAQGEYKLVLSGNTFAEGNVEIIVKNTKDVVAEDLVVDTPEQVVDGTIGGIEGEKIYNFTVADYTISSLNLNINDVTGFITCTVVDANGNQIYKGTSNTAINKVVSNLTAGDYQVILSANKEVNFDLDMELTVDQTLAAPDAADVDNVAATTDLLLAAKGEYFGDWVGATDDVDWVKVDLNSNGYTKVYLTGEGSKVYAEVWRVAKGETDESAMKLISSFNVDDATAYRNINFKASDYDYYVKVIADNKDTASTNYTIALK